MDNHPFRHPFKNQDWSWQDKCKTVQERDRYLLENEILTDCSFLVGKGENIKEIKAHKIYLGKSSPTFSDMMFGDHRVNMFPIHVPDITPEAFQAMLLYVYTGESHCETVKLVEDVLLAAEKFEMYHLVELCNRKLGNPCNKVSARAP